jgi:response regulator RpfG family c-di-GMP phosphodiesterase
MDKVIKLSHILRPSLIQRQTNLMLTMPAEIYNIFYTDDDKDDLEIFKEVVAEINENIYIFTQNNGKQLMDMLNSPPPAPHIIFLDLNMPVKNGYEVLKEIRQNVRMNAIPIIIFSTSNDDRAIAETRKLGATLYVPKPASYSELKVILRHLFGIDWGTFKTDDKNFLYNTKSNSAHGA